MRRFVLILIALLLVLPVAAFAQQIVERDDFSNMSGWRVGAGDWGITNERLVQSSETEKLARIDRELPVDGEYQIDFVIRYEGGGYEDQAAYRQRQFHAGFGIHIGAENPPFGRAAWGNGESYLLWLNLDTRPDTRSEYPEHYGFRAQVYESFSNVDMELFRDRSIAQLLGSEVLSVDLMQALENYGVDLSLADLQPYLQRDVPMSIRVNTNTGRIGVKDPTAPIRFYFNVDPEKLQGDYISLRTNSLAASFDDFTIRTR